MERRRRSAEPRGGGEEAKDAEVEMVELAEGDGSRFWAAVTAMVEIDGVELA